MKPLGKVKKSKHVVSDTRRWEHLYNMDVYKECVDAQDINYQLGLTNNSLVLHPGWVVELVVESDDPNMVIKGGIYLVEGVKPSDNPVFTLLDPFFKYAYKQGDYIHPVDKIRTETTLRLKDIKDSMVTIYVCCKDPVECSHMVKEIRAHRNSPRLIPEGQGKELSKREMDIIDFKHRDEIAAPPEDLAQLVKNISGI